MTPRYNILLNGMYLATDFEKLFLVMKAETNCKQIAHFHESELSELLVKSMSKKSWRYDNDYEVYTATPWRVEKC